MTFGKPLHMNPTLSNSKPSNSVLVFVVFYVCGTAHSVYDGYNFDPIFNNFAAWFCSAAKLLHEFLKRGVWLFNFQDEKVRVLAFLNLEIPPPQTLQVRNSSKPVSTLKVGMKKWPSRRKSHRAIQHFWYSFSTLKLREQRCRHAPSRVLPAKSVKHTKSLYTHIFRVLDFEHRW